MKSLTVEADENVQANRRAAPLLRREASVWLELTKPRITLMVVLTAAAGFYLGAGVMDYATLFHLLLGVGILSSGVATLNQAIEIVTDGQMRRTARRPLPAGKISRGAAAIFGGVLCLFGEIYLYALVNPLTAWLGLSVIIGYVVLYTPLKTRTSLATVIGAFPGAMPAVLGWAAARDELGVGAWALFAIMFLWQFPHFLAISWLYREDYARAGVLMLPVVEPEGNITARQIVLHTILLLPISLLPFMLGISGTIYLIGAVVLGAWFLARSITMARARTNANAKKLLLTSVIYLPLLFVLMVLNRL